MTTPDSRFPAPALRPLATKRVYEGRILRVDVDKVEAPDGSELSLEMVRHPGAAAVVPLLDDRTSDDPNILLIKQFRYAARGAIWEIPAGVLDPGEAPVDCARRELQEETGAHAAEFHHLTTIFTTPGFTDEQIHLFLATGVTVGEPNHEADEFIEIEARSLTRVLEMVRTGEIVDGKTLVALLFMAGFWLNM